VLVSNRVRCALTGESMTESDGRWWRVEPKERIVRRHSTVSRRGVGEDAPPYFVVFPELLFVVTAAPR
jgi:hypothetical protein